MQWAATTAAPSACCGGLPLRDRSTPWRAPAAGAGSRKEHAGSRKREAAHLAHVRHPLRQRLGARRHVVQQPVGAVDDEVGDQARHHAVRNRVRQGHHRKRQERRDSLQKGSRTLQFYLRILACKVDPFWMPMGSWQAGAHSTDPSELVQNKQWVYDHRLWQACVLQRYPKGRSVRANEQPEAFDITTGFSRWCLRTTGASF